MKFKTVSIVIRVFNAEEDLKRCLRLLREQILPIDTELEIIIVDNESKDNSVLVSKEYGAKITTISKSDFTWGRALNQGISISTGDIVLLLSADAYPADKKWIEHMINPFEDSSIAAVYGRQIPRDDAPIDEVVRLHKYFPSVNRIFSKNDSITQTGRGMIVSNACAAIRKSIWITRKYDEKVEGGEEGIWTYLALEEGYKSYYNSEARVYHSHNDPPPRRALRQLELISKNASIQNSNFTKEVFKYPFVRLKKTIVNIRRVENHKKSKLVEILYFIPEILLFYVFSLLWKTRYRTTLRKRFW
ncbi:glycosyltransferase family 2 protein [Pelagicoccus enzymogenes]|uniref:glycosyltransferase family 2 protein n=1 Tax=Pelagicoccus enzymogenes TaxID=2773457 RepID=UPI00280FF8AC|nr:glycosyltransferase family 2 protein [Pelagicoccus enzymogenes]MDQ8201095.1 glycosyltransferase family 2 protein [Pelagicoccus enzymogenes]